MNIGGIFESYDLSSLKLITYGTEPMSENLLNILKNKLSKTKLIQTFGTSETGIIKTKSKSSGSLLVKFEDNDQEIKIMDGELWIKNLHIPPYQPGNVPDSYQSEQRRKILVKEHEMISFARKQKEAGLSLVPISIYQKGRILKVELGLVKGIFVRRSNKASFAGKLNRLNPIGISSIYWGA